MEQRVHRPGSHHAVFAQFLIAFRGEIRLQRFQVAPLVPAPALDDPEQVHCPVQRFLLPGQPVVSRKAVDRKRLAVGMLGGVRRFSVKGDRPEDAAVHRVLKPAEEFHRMVGADLVFRAARGQRGRGKGPQDPAVQDASLVCRPVQDQVIVHFAVKAAVQIVLQVHPERQDLLFQLGPDFIPEHRQTPFVNLFEKRPHGACGPA